MALWKMSHDNIHTERVFLQSVFFYALQDLKTGSMLYHKPFFSGKFIFFRASKTWVCFARMGKCLQKLMSVPAGDQQLNYLIKL